MCREDEDPGGDPSRTSSGHSSVLHGACFFEATLPTAKARVDLRDQDCCRDTCSHQGQEACPGPLPERKLVKGSGSGRRGHS